MIRTRRVAAAGMAVAVVLLAGVTWAGAGVSGPTPSGTPVRLYTRMTGAAERPTPTNSPGVGDAVVYVYPNDVVCTVLRVANLTTPVTGAHIHIAPPTDPGPIVVPLDPPLSGFSYTCRAVSASIANGLRTNPTAYYVNVHTTRFLGGEIRGQLAAL